MDINVPERDKTAHGRRLWTKCYPVITGLKNKKTPLSQCTSRVYAVVDSYIINHVACLNQIHWPKH